MKKSKVKALIAEALEALAKGDSLPAGEGALVGLTNEQTIDADGWALIAPFGEWPKTRVFREGGQVKEQEYIQVLDNAAADLLIDQENSLFRKIRRAVVGIPVYKLHGDLNDVDPKALSNESRKIKLGVVDQVRKGARGIEAHFALDNDGAQAVAEGFKFPSAFWWVLPNGKRGDSILARPFKLISVALTPYPNISGVESLANARPAGSENNAALSGDAATATRKENEMIKSLIIGWLAARGIVLANEATDQQVLDALQRHASGLDTQTAALGNEKSTLSGRITALENELAPLKQKAQQQEAALANEQTARKAERKGRAEAVVDLAIARGKLAVAERDDKVTALTNSAEFDKDATALLDAATKYRMAGTIDAQSGKVLANEAEDAVAEYNREFQKALANNGQDPVRAHAAVMRLPGLADKLRVKGR